MRGKVACFVHANREAATSCGVCGHPLCPTCAINHNDIDYCDACAPPEALRTGFDDDYARIPVIDPAKSAPATFGQRLMAFLIDLMLFVLIGGLIGIIGFWFTGKFFVASPQYGASFWMVWLVLLGAGITYSSVMTSMSGQTFGKKIMNVIVLKPNGHILDWRTATIRTICAVFSALPFGLGFLWMLWDPNHKTWHDNIAQTSAFQYEEVV